ncbi:hypothetical protein COCON_G00099140 [Conger conger]|uniref:Uncharacterized protein n=1 Tax=Conger conger TaxID=82655 RepID=A0A9Q1DMS7_CONCO|nr:hypothetical protein COCON_G00099140 [Conger conger]
MPGLAAAGRQDRLKKGSRAAVPVLFTITEEDEQQKTSGGRKRRRRRRRRGRGRVPGDISLRASGGERCLATGRTGGARVSRRICKQWCVARRGPADWLASRVPPRGTRHRSRAVTTITTITQDAGATQSFHPRLTSHCAFIWHFWICV